MCGIAGIWNHKSDRPVDRERLQAITQLVAHRGPDGVGYYWGPGPGLGHRRLSIIDVEGGRQPMCNEDESIWITFNGEIYNFPELRQQLLGRGHVFRTNSDTETILHLYEDCGEACFDKLRGMFALALWDSRNRRLVLARDRLGIKPLFYGLSSEGIVFGSELKCVRDSEQVELSVEPTAIADLFTYFYIPGPKTIFRNVYSLEPGHYMVVTRTGIRKQKYWDLSGEELRLPTETDYEERLYDLLNESVHCHLVSDVPVGAFLSGGVDSSAVVALMSNSVSRPIMTCSIGFNEQEYNELPRARTVAHLFATNHSERIVTPEPAKVLEQLVNFYDQPFPDHSSIPTYYVSQLARERVKVVLSGDGGDETFGGYSRYRRHFTLERIRRSMPHAMQVSLLHCLKSRGGRRQNGNILSRLGRVLHQVAIGSRDGYLNGITIADTALRALMFSEDLQHELADYDPFDSFRDIYNRAPRPDPLSKIFYLDLKTYLVDDILTKVDRASMANSLEVRVPFLDHKVVEFAYSLPLELKLRDGLGKYLLRKAMRRHLPSTYLDVAKRGFRIPMVPWMRGELGSWMQAALFGRCEASPFLNYDGVRQVWEWFQEGRSHLTDVLSIVLSFTLSSPVWARGSAEAIKR